MNLEHVQLAEEDDCIEKALKSIVCHPEGKHVILVPGRLRPFVEHDVLTRISLDRGRLPSGVLPEVHSIASFVRAFVDAEHSHRLLSMSGLCAFLAARMHEDDSMFRRAGDVFGSADQFARQVHELVNAGVTAADLEQCARIGYEYSEDQCNDRLMALSVLVKHIEESLPPQWALPGGNALDAARYVQDRGQTLHVYVYGFERFDGAEMRLMNSLCKYADLHLLDADELPGWSDEFPDESVVRQNERKVQPGQLRYAQTPIDELRWVANEVCKLVKNDGVPAREILVTARDLELYRSLLNNEFAYYDVPVNASPLATMADHPLAELVIGLLDPQLYEGDITSQKASQALLRVFRAGLLRGEWNIPQRDLDDIELKMYTEDPRTLWPQKGQSEEGSTRQSVLAKHLRAMLALRGQAESVFHRATGSVRERLEAMIRFLGNNIERRDDDSLLQAWAALIELFDELAELVGEEDFSVLAPTFADTVADALSGVPLGKPDRATNAVDVLAFPTPMRHYRYVFMMGADEGQLPRLAQENGLLSDRERHVLVNYEREHGKPVTSHALDSLTLRKKTDHEWEAFYRVARHADHLIVSYAVGSNGEPSPSPYVRKDSKDTGKPIEMSECSHNLQMSTVQEAHGISSDRAYELFTQEVDAKTVLDLSVSSIESYYRNPYQFFLEKGLRVRKPQAFDLDVAAQGTYYHGVLQHAVDLWKEANPQASLTTDSIMPYLRRCWNLSGSEDGWSVLQDDPRLSILDYTNRMKAVHEQLKAILERFMYMQDEWRSSTGLQMRYDDNKSADTSTGLLKTIPLHTELQFGELGDENGMWDPHTLPVEDIHGDVTVRVRGKVDRIDLIEWNGHQGRVVIDYKRSAKDLFVPGNKGIDADSVYYGRELQLLTYAHVVDENTKGKPPIAAVMFLPITAADSTDIDGKYFSQRLADDNTGNNESDSVSLFASAGMPGVGIPRIVSAPSLNKSEMFIGPWHQEKGRTAFVNVSSDDFHRLLQFADEKIQEAAEGILRGDLPVRPYRISGSDNDGMRWCDYKSIMAIDVIDDDVFHTEGHKNLSDVIEEHQKKDDQR